MAEARKHVWKTAVGVSAAARTNATEYCENCHNPKTRQNANGVCLG